MGWLNYHHLLYFWTVARTGSIVAASKELFLSQPAISSQIKSLEAVLGTALFARSGRGRVLTPAGERAFAYADQIFRLGRELRAAVGPELPAPAPVGVSSLPASARRRARRDRPASLPGTRAAPSPGRRAGRGPPAWSGTPSAPRFPVR